MLLSQMLETTGQDQYHPPIATSAVSQPHPKRTYMFPIKNFFAQYCDRCIHSHLDPTRGVICGLTDQRPDRTKPCADLVIDAEREEDVELRQHLKSRFELYRSLDDEGPSTNPYPDPQGNRTRGWRWILVQVLTALMVLLVGAVVWLKIFTDG